MLVCDTHADTLYALSAPDRPAGGPLDVTAELLTAGAACGCSAWRCLYAQTACA